MNNEFLYNGILYLYNNLEFMVLFLVGLTTVTCFINLYQKKSSGFNLRLSLLTLIMSFIFSIFGLLIFFTNLFNDYVKTSSSMVSYTGYDSVYSLTENILNLFGLILITIGWSLYKKHSSITKKNLRLGIFYLLGFLILYFNFEMLNFF